MAATPAHSNDARSSGFTGRPSVQARISAPTLRLLRSIAGLVGVDLGTSINTLIASRHPPRRTTRAVTVRHREFNGWDVCTLRPESLSGQHVLAIHGGAFVCEATVLHWRDYAAIARQTSATVVVPAYPLAPHGTAGTVVPQMADLITWMIGEHGLDNVSVYGDSAGGGIALCAAQELVRRNATPPARMVLLSPLLDATLSNPDIQFVNDPVLSTDALKVNFALWAADLDLADPLVSPLHGSLSGLGATAVYAGSLDVLGPDAVALQAKSLATPGTKFSFDLRYGEMHDWAMTSWLPEARGVRSQIYHQLLGT
ncbi:alpha/beta hydrolase fold domain-containing protein [Mycobacterium sp. Aquia_216]|uniref:alpha/beta hydrolase fold domain-containing protein n=1 Tax=Mycobacterium sp. Aquia_216 TaxID=2991729 RepID=UPI00227C9AC3|nr:alpha/beta hydrolase fold domain-containing protein [Mycobacterium sp. Aquia_216]WAJ43763.1 alpha/beta hydrolase fold domain-containing protein [Mycobacterium sp. Aquia_216]